VNTTAVIPTCQPFPAIVCNMGSVLPFCWFIYITLQSTANVRQTHYGILLLLLHHLFLNIACLVTMPLLISRELPYVHYSLRYFFIPVLHCIYYVHLGGGLVVPFDLMDIRFLPFLVTSIIACLCHRGCFSRMDSRLAYRAAFVDIIPRHNASSRHSVHRNILSFASAANACLHCAGASRL